MAVLFKWNIFILLPFILTLVAVKGERNVPQYKRVKREWILAPRKLAENFDYTTFDYIAKIRSDKENFTIQYFLTGPGVDKDPTGRFSVDSKTGYVKVHTILDREDIAQYNLKGIAKFLNGSRAENDIDLIIKVDDENDNAPIIKTQQVGSVSEHSKQGTVVMRVNATDADDPTTKNTIIYYSIDPNSNRDGLFYIDSITGEVRVAKTTLDREVKDTYRLTIIAADRYGASGGQTGTGEIEIKVMDINDNMPTMEKDSYECSVEENMVGLEVLRVKSIDKDQINTDNWFAVYEIISGNEGGYFTITTDPKTNEGVIRINKAVDYEEIKTMNLNVAVSNKAAYNFGSSAMTGASSSHSYPIKVNILNQKEGPRFQPSVKVVTTSESVSQNEVITTYSAIDSDTLKTATNVRYAKLRDDDNWLSIDENTAEIRLKKSPDRESKFLKNGTYYAEIVCISNDIPSKTATGTLAIQVEDFNDHCPELIATSQTMCFEDHAIYVSAVDKDAFPNAAPFEFAVIQDDKQSWVVEPLNETTAILRDEAKLWPGSYKVKVVVKDQQGKSCGDFQAIDLVVCTCNQKTKTCLSRSGSTATLGVAGVLLLLLGLLLLLLIPCLLLFCLCGAAARSFKPIPVDVQEHLISYHTEGQGEDMAVPQLQLPVGLGNVNTSGQRFVPGWVETDQTAGGGGGGAMTKEDLYMYEKYRNIGQEHIGMDFMGTGTLGGQSMHYSHSHNFGVFNGMALSDHFLADYYSNKSISASQQNQKMENAYNYNYEGEGSLAGSVGCCSILENDSDLAFLNDLGPKFTTLAEICNGGSLVCNSVNVEVSKPSIQPVSPVIPSTSTHTQVHTHTETFRDRDRVKVNIPSTSGVAAKSSTVIHEERINARSQGSASAPKVQVQEQIVIPNQTLLIQQPAMYYAATPMYVVESKPQMVLVSGGTQQVAGQVSQAGISQGMMQVSGLQGSQGVVFVEEQVGMGGAKGQVGTGVVAGQVGMGVVTGQVGMGGATGQVAKGLSQGTVSESTQVFVVENGSTGGKQGTHLVQGFGQMGLGSSGSGLGVRGNSEQVKTFSGSSHGSVGSKEDFALMTSPKFQNNQRVVVQHKKVSVTERNIGSSTSS